MIELYFDGAVEPFNPGGHGGYGLVVYQDGRVIHSEAVYVGQWPTLSNNCTEYAGCIAALRYLIREGVTEATVYGDADMIIRQINGHWKAKSGAYVPYYREAYSLRQKVPNVKFIWIPRERNDAADCLSKEAVTRQPRIIEFQLDPSVEILAAPDFKKKRKRTRDTMRMNLFEDMTDDEAWQMFRSRVEGL